MTEIFYNNLDIRLYDFDVADKDFIFLIRKIMKILYLVESSPRFLKTINNKNKMLHISYKLISQYGFPKRL